MNEWHISRALPPQSTLSARHHRHDQSVDHVLADDGGERRVRVGSLEPGVGDEAVGRLRQVDAVPAHVRVGVLARRRPGEPAGGAHVVVVGAAAAAARTEGAALVTCKCIASSALQLQRMR